MIRLWQRGIMGIRGTVFAFALAWIAALAVAGEFPGAHWQTVAPAEVGLDEGKLREISEYFGGRGCVVRHGRMVFTWGDAARRGDVASAAKPVYAHLLYAALEEGLLDSLDTPVKNYVPELAELNAALGQKDAAMTFAQMATQTSCYGVREAPGAAFNYNDWQMELLVDTLLLKMPTMKCCGRGWATCCNLRTRRRCWRSVRETGRGGWQFRRGILRALGCSTCTRGAGRSGT